MDRVVCLTVLPPAISELLNCLWSAGKDQLGMRWKQPSTATNTFSRRAHVEKQGGCIPNVVEKQLYGQKGPLREHLIVTN